MVSIKKQASGKKRVRKPASTGIGSRIRPIGFEDSTGLSFNIYGRSGTGKTTLWATFPKPILALVCSGGSNPGELRSIDTPEYRKTIKQLQIRKTDDIREAIDYQKEEGVFKTIVLDHASGLQDFTLKEILDLDELPAQSSWGMARQQDWGECALRMKEMLRALLSLTTDTNVVIVAQEREFNTDVDSDVLMPYVGSALTPSVTGWLNPACDYICQTFIRERMEDHEVTIGKKKVTRQKKGKGVEYCLRTGPSSIFTTKFRVPKGRDLPEIMVDPDYKKLVKLIKHGG